MEKIDHKKYLHDAGVHESILFKKMLFFFGTG